MVRLEAIGTRESDVLDPGYPGLIGKRKPTMAVIHPQDRIVGVRRESRPLHPAIGLVIGFGAIILIATVVHVVFNQMF